MHKLRHLFIIFLLVTGQITLEAQNNEFKAGLRAGHNAAFGQFAAASIESNQYIYKDISINGGVQYNTIGKTSLEAHPSYDFRFDWGKLTAETIFAYINFSSINSFSIGAGAKAYLGKMSAKLGYFYHQFGRKGEKITEPVNFYYELCAYLLQKNENWDLRLLLTNCELFELERQYQPSFIAECSHNLSTNLEFILGLGYKPSGVFCISADYYQTFIKTGICYRW